MAKIKDMLIYVLLLLLCFYVSPLFIKDTGSAMFILLLEMPLINFIVSLFYGLKKGFCLEYSIIVGIIFFPSVFLFYNSSALIYVLLYAFTAFLGNLLGFLFKRTHKGS